MNVQTMIYLKIYQIEGILKMLKIVIFLPVCASPESLLDFFGVTETNNN